MRKPCIENKIVDVNQLPHHLPKRAISDIRPPRVFAAPHNTPAPQSAPEPPTWYREEEVSSPRYAPIATAPVCEPVFQATFQDDPEASEEDVKLEEQLEALELEDWFGTSEFRTVERNPKRAFLDQDALRPREKPASEVILPPIGESVTPLTAFRVAHSLAGRKRPKHRVTFAEHSQRVRRWGQTVIEHIAQASSHREEWFSLLRRAIRGRSPKQWAGIAGVGVCLWLGMLAYQGFSLRGEVLGTSQAAVDNMQLAVGNLKQKDLLDSQRNFEDAAQGFGEASQQLNDWNGTLVELSRFVPVASQLASGKYALEAGQHFALAGSALNSALKTSLDASKQGIEGLPLLTLLGSTKRSTTTALQELQQAKEALDKVNIDDLPQDKREKFLLIRENLPTILSSMQLFLDQSTLLADVFGANGPRKYLFLLQNNQEARATGGFIGTYALLDIQNGRVRKFFVDGIFNPDGQLTQSIVPPSPLQKVSGAWSMHDSNWFPDFPVSARKAISFYEKTGGPTVDGVITLTPTVIQKLLTLTGPITMDEYNVTLDADNFMALVQDQVEFHYDKQENKPKKILADLIPLMLDRLTSVKNVNQVKQVLSTLESSLNEKHILLYASDNAVQQRIREAGWSGEVLEASRDYLSVINTNINGYKTDGVVEQSIRHQAEIRDDGSVIDTVTVTRKHNGGNTPYDFWNRVNADYMRVYVPQGATLLSAEGQTRETVKPPLDYQALHFSTDPDVVAEEKSITIDPKTGTRIYDQFGKTVFANWVYLSPGETVSIKYVYRLPFHIESKNADDTTVIRGSYSTLFQKQSGSIDSALVSTVSYPKNWISLWQTPSDLVASDTQLSFKKQLQTDQFYGIVFGYPEQ
jgi:hypothetical protein